MLDLVLFIFVMAFLALGVRKPFLWVLCYIYIDILLPQKIGWTLTPALPISLIAFCAAFAGWVLTDSKRNMSISGRQVLMGMLLLYAGMTTGWAEFQQPALEKWDWVWKSLVFAIFLPFTLTTRLRIEAAGLVIILSAAAIMISGGIKTVLAGGGYDSLSLFVRDNTGIYESSTLAATAIAMIPLILWLSKHGTIFPSDWRVKTFAYALVFSCLLLPVGTEARTGLICIAVLALLQLRVVKHRIAFLIAAGALGVMALPFMPQTFYDRMATMTNPSGDESASTRVRVWEWTLDYVDEKPLGGGFDAYRGNSFTYRLPVEKESEINSSSTTVKTQEVTDEGRAYHSAYFEVLGEQGWPGLFIWLALQLTGLWQMEKIRRRWGGRTGDDEQWQGPLAVALQSYQIIYLVGALFIGIAYQALMLVMLGLQIALYAHCKRADRAESKGFRSGPEGVAASAPERVKLPNRNDGRALGPQA